MSKLPCSLRSLAPLLWTRSYSRSAALRFRPKGFPDEDNLQFYLPRQDQHLILLDAGWAGNIRRAQTAKHNEEGGYPFCGENV